MSRRQNPSEFLKQIIGKPVVVKLNSGVDYRGMYIWFIVNIKKNFFFFLTYSWSFIILFININVLF